MKRRRVQVSLSVKFELLSEEKIDLEFLRKEVLERLPGVWYDSVELKCTELLGLEG